MSSIQSKVFNFLLSLVTKSKFIRNQFASGKSMLYDSAKPPRKIFKTCNVLTHKINNRNVFTLSPKNKEVGEKHILYLHGGAYVQNFLTFHWSFTARLVAELNCTITAPDYPLAPDHTYKESFEMLTSLYSQLLMRAKPHDIIFMGDSSGGGFALALAQKMQSILSEQPDQIILLSPWLDITLSNPLMKDVDAIQPFLSLDELRRAGKMYAGDTSPEHYLLSPINGSLEGLGKISVFMGTKDILLADARKFQSLAESKGVAINYFEYEGMIHAWMFLNFPESKRVMQQIAGLVGAA